MTSPASPDSRRSRIARALAYPYARLPDSSVYFQGQALPWSAETLALCRSRELTPVLAVGSNASTEQLIRKFGHDPTTAVPVSVGYLHDHDVVFAAYMTAYGSLPATLIDSPGCSVRIAVTWLDSAALRVMHQTEGVGHRTCYGRLDNLRFDGRLLNAPDPDRLDGIGRPQSRAYTYQSLTGALAVGGAPIALGELTAKGRSLNSLGQQGLQRRLRRWLEPERLLAGEAVEPDFASWVDRNTCSEERRAGINRWLDRHRIDLRLAGFTIESVAGGSE